MALLQLSGGIAKAFGLDDGPTHAEVAIAKGRALGDATQIVFKAGRTGC